MNAVIGFVAGLITGSLVIVLHKVPAEKEVKHQEFKCKTQATMGCEDLCCHFCMASSECRHSCKNNPSDCGQAVKL